MTTTLTQPSEITPTFPDAGATALAAFLPGIWTRIGWIAPDGMTLEEYEQAGDALLHWELGRAWCLGDFVIYGESRWDWGEMYAQAMDVSGLSYDRLSHFVSMCRRFPFERRRHTLTFNHHEQIAARRFAIKEQEYWLDMAERNRWNAAELGRQVKAWEQEARNDQLAEGGVITDVESVQVEPQFEWLDQTTGEIVDDPGDDGPESVVPLVTCPHCGVPFPWRGISIQQEGANGTGS